MIIKEINKDIFDKFALTHIQGSYFQTSNYSILMNNYKYNVMYIGIYKENFLIGASLILYKSIAPLIKYGYAPRGFILDYLNNEYLEETTQKIKEFFAKKTFAFVKINPELIYSKIDTKNKKKEVIPESKKLITHMRELGYQKLRNNLYFEAMLPKYNAIINLKKFNKNNVNNKCLVKSHSIINKSLKLKKGSLKDIKLFYEFIKEKSNKTLNYYEDFYKVFNKNDMIDLLLIEIDYYKYLEIFKNKLEKMNYERDIINKDFLKNPFNNEIYLKKADYDKKIISLEKSISLINKKLKQEIKKEIIGGILTIKQNNKVSLIISGINKDFSTLNYKYFMYYKSLNYYKRLGYSFFDLNGISGNFTEKNPYKGLNNFKLSFNPDVYEYIGEFDLVVNETYYNILWDSGKLRREFIH